MPKGKIINCLSIYLGIIAKILLKYCCYYCCCRHDIWDHGRLADIPDAFRILGSAEQGTTYKVTPLRHLSARWPSTALFYLLHCRLRLPSRGTQELRSRTVGSFDYYHSVSQNLRVNSVVLRRSVGLGYDPRACGRGRMCPRGTRQLPLNVPKNSYRITFPYI